MKNKVLFFASIIATSVIFILGTINLSDQSKEKIELDLEQYGLPLVHRENSKDLELIALHYQKKAVSKNEKVLESKTNNIKKEGNKNSQNKLEETKDKSVEIKSVEPKEKYVSYETVETKGTIAYNTIEESTDQLDEGQINLLRAGEDGVYKIIDKYEVVDGEGTLISSEKIIIKEALDEIIQVGIRKEKEVDGIYDISIAYETLAYVNELRSKHGLQQLNWNESLAYASHQRSIEIAQTFSHTRPNGSAWYTVDERIMAENIAYGQKSARAVIESFNNSSVHQENMMSSKWTSMYVSLYVKDGVYYWVQHFA